MLESEQGGVKLTKTYTFKRGDYTIDLKHTVTNDSGAPVAPSLYEQLVHDGNKPPGDSMFYSTFTGPTVYTDADKFQKITFDKIKEGKADHARQTDNGWIAMVQHYFVSALIPQGKAAARNLHQDGRTQPVRGRHHPAAGHDCAGRQHHGRHPAVFRSADFRSAGKTRARAWTWSRTTAG